MTGAFNVVGAIVALVIVALGWAIGRLRDEVRSEQNERRSERDS